MSGELLSENEKHGEQKGREDRIAEAIVSKLKISTNDTSMPFAEAGIQLNDEMLSYNPSKDRYEVLPGIVEQVLTIARVSAEGCLDPNSSEYNPYRGFQIAAKFELEPNFVQKAGDMWATERLQRIQGEERQGRLEVITTKILDFSYVPPEPILSEAVIAFLRAPAFSKDKVGLRTAYLKLKEKLQAKNIDIDPIIEEQAPDLEEDLTSPE